MSEFDRSRCAIKITLDGVDFRDLELHDLIAKLSIVEEDDKMASVTVAIRNDDFERTEQFLTAKRSTLQVFIGYVSSFDDESTTPLKLFGTFIIDEPEFSFPPNGTPMIMLKGFSEEIILAETENQMDHGSKPPTEMVRDIAQNTGSKKDRVRRNKPFGIDFIQGLPAFPSASPNAPTKEVEQSEEETIWRANLPEMIELGVFDSQEHALSSREHNVDPIAEIGDTETKKRVTEFLNQRDKFTSSRGTSNQSFRDVVSALSKNKKQTESDYTFVKKLAEMNGFQFFIVPKVSARGSIFFGRLTEEVINELSFDPNLTLRYRPTEGDGSVKTAKFKSRTYNRGLKVETEVVNPFTKGKAPGLARLQELIASGSKKATEEGPKRHIEQTSNVDTPQQSVEDIQNRIRVDEGRGTKRPTIFLKRFGNSDNPEELERHRKAIEEQGLWAIEGTLTPTVGVIDLRTRTFVTIEGVGPFSGKYYVKKITHNWNSNVLTQNLLLRSFRLSKSPTELTVEGKVEPKIVASVAADGTIEEFSDGGGAGELPEFRRVVGP